LHIPGNDEEECGDNVAQKDVVIPKVESKKKVKGIDHLGCLVPVEIALVQQIGFEDDLFIPDQEDEKENGTDDGIEGVNLRERCLCPKFEIEHHEE
jgi:hypothetical protein